MNLECRNFILLMGLFIVGPLLLNYNDAWANRSGERIRHQRERIEEGVSDGSISNKEARNLRRSGRKIRNYRREANADGSLSAQEKKKLERMQDRRSARIYKDKHDSDGAGSGRPSNNSTNAPASPDSGAATSAPNQ